VWANSKDEHEKNVRENRLWWGKNGSARVPAKKNFLSDIQQGMMPMSLWHYEFAGTNQDAKKEIKALFGTKLFDTPKPEKLISIILQIATNPGDLVLDSFLGSGTTAAVAHKMGRRWIGVELGDHCYTHCKVRLDKVIDGTAAGGITKAVDWKGGGGYRFYELAPTLIKKDRWGQMVINPEYDAEKLAEAVCKLEGFTYAPSESEYFIHGKSTERDYIYVTTNYLKAEHLRALSELVGSERTLLICCKGFENCGGRGATALPGGALGDRALPGGMRFPNLTVKKIPKAVLDKCEYGHDDYSLNVKNLPMAAPGYSQCDLFD
jgi:adenine-specific DNA-methyltransferase